MTDLLKTGLAWLQGERVAHMSQPAVYVRGDDEIAIHVTHAASSPQVLDGEGFALDVDLHDFLIPAAELVLGSGPLTPRPGDRIRESSSGAEIAWEVADLGSEGCFRRNEEYGLDLRVHVKRLGG